MINHNIPDDSEFKSLHVVLKVELTNYVFALEGRMYVEKYMSANHWHWRLRTDDHVLIASSEPHRDELKCDESIALARVAEFAPIQRANAHNWDWCYPKVITIPRDC